MLWNICSPICYEIFAFLSDLLNCTLVIEAALIAMEWFHTFTTTSILWTLIVVRIVTLIRSLVPWNCIFYWKHLSAVLMKWPQLKYIYIYIAFYNKRVFLETVSQIGPKVMMYNQNTVYILGLNFFKDFWYDWKRWEAVESQRVPVNCQWVNTRCFGIWLVKITVMKLMILCFYMSHTCFRVNLNSAVAWTSC